MGGSPPCRSGTNHAGSCLIHAVASRAVDVLTDLLPRSRARRAAFSHSTAHGDWGVAFGQVPGVAVHAIVEGDIHVWAHDPGAALGVGAGDLVLVRGAVAHQMAHPPGAPGTPVVALGAPAASSGGGARRVVIGDVAGGERARFFCGAYMFEGDVCDG